MDREIAEKAYNIEFTHPDLGVMTVKGYLKKLLSTLWEEEESFSGKKPWGNGGWQYDLVTPLCRAGLVEGVLLGTYGSFEEWEVSDFPTYLKFVADLIEEL